MKHSAHPMPNVVTDMVEETRKNLQLRAQQLNDQREAVAMERVFWNEVREMCESPGWANLMQMQAAEIEKLRELLEQPGEEYVTNVVRGSIKTLRELRNLSSLATARLSAAGEAEETLNVELENFVETGA